MSTGRPVARPSRSPAPADRSPQQVGRLAVAARRAQRTPAAAYERSPHEPLVALLIDAAIAHTKADLGLLDSAERHLSPLAAAQGVGPGR